MSRDPIIIAVLLHAASACIAAGGPSDAMEPVNTVFESGQDIGPCETGGALSYPAAPRKGLPYFLLQADRGLAARHLSLTHDKDPWLRRLDGPAGTNRLFTAANGESAIVFWSCKARDCGSHTAYGAYEPRSGRYMMQVRQQGATTTLGDTTALLGSAITCARAMDERMRDSAAEALKRAGSR